MSQFITTAFVQQYATTIALLLQQRGSKFRGTVTEAPYVGKAGSPVEQIGQTAAQKRTARYDPIVPNDTPHDRRWVYPSDYDWSELVDKVDKLRMLTDPTGPYVTNGLYGMGRAIDDEIVPAFFGTAKTGETGATSTTFPAAQQVAVNFEAAGNVGLTVAKLKKAREILLAAEVDMEAETPSVAISAKQNSNLLTESQAINMDYVDKPVVTEGNIVKIMGFNVKHSERLQTDGTGYRRVPVWVKSGMHLGLWQDITSDVSQRRDLRGLPWQVYVFGTFGATRLEEKRVVEIKCNEA